MSEQPLHRERVNIELALAEMGPTYMLYSRARMQPNAPAFSGGVLDSWPAHYVQAFEICRQEEAAVIAWEKGKAAASAVPNG